ncbi:PLP-dependent transferase [Yersinia rochesterensis]|nr:PLP-dependent transferase [Yersinia rochesterensis]MDN0105881.1 PLP-dependent transferase [Yersinia rochesterensis]
MNIDAIRKSFSTRAIHYGDNLPENLGALPPPVYISATFPSAEYGGACFAGTEKGSFYSRISNPTLYLLERRIAILEGGMAAWVAFLNALQLIYRAANLGDGEILAQHPVSMTHFSYTPEERR